MSSYASSTAIVQLASMVAERCASTSPERANSSSSTGLLPNLLQETQCVAANDLGGILVGVVVFHEPADDVLGRFRRVLDTFDIVDALVVLMASRFDRKARLVRVVQADVIA